MLSKQLQYIKSLFLALVSVGMSAPIIWSIFITKIFALFLFTGYYYIITRKCYSFNVLNQIFNQITIEDLNMFTLFWFIFISYPS